MRKAYLVLLLFIALFAVSYLARFSGKQKIQYFNSENVYHPDELSNNDYLANSFLKHINNTTGTDSTMIILCRNN